MEESTIRVYGSKTCWDTVRTRRFLRQHRIPYAWFDVDEDGDALALIKSVNQGNRTTPTTFLTDGSILFEPSDVELASRLGI